LLSFVPTFNNFLRNKNDELKMNVFIFCLSQGHFITRWPMHINRAMQNYTNCNKLFNNSVRTFKQHSNNSKVEFNWRCQSGLAMLRIQPWSVLTIEILVVTLHRLSMFALVLYVDWWHREILSFSQKMQSLTGTLWREFSKPRFLRQRRSVKKFKK
jgi:hypothetical protein